MPRYCKQQDQFSCGPVALLNAMKWAGKRVSYGDLPALRLACKCVPSTGTVASNLARASRQLIDSHTIKHIHRPSLKLLNNHLEIGSFILNYGFLYHGEPHGHYIFCFKGPRGVCKAVNYDLGHSPYIIKQSTLKDLLGFQVVYDNWPNTILIN